MNNNKNDKMVIGLHREPLYQDTAYVSRVHVTDEALNTEIDVGIRDCDARLCGHFPLAGFSRINLYEGKGSDAQLRFSCESWGKNKYVDENAGFKIDGNLNVESIGSKDFKAGWVFIKKRFYDKYGHEKWRPVLGIRKGATLDGLRFFGQDDEGRFIPMVSANVGDVMDGKLQIQKGREKYVVLDNESLKRKLMYVGDRIMMGKNNDPAQQKATYDTKIALFKGAYLFSAGPAGSITGSMMRSPNPTVRTMGYVGVGAFLLPSLVMLLYLRQKALDEGVLNKCLKDVQAHTPKKAPKKSMPDYGFGM